MNENYIALNLRRIRAARVKSQSDIAAIAGISLPTYRNVENGLTIPRVDTLITIARALGVKLQDLVEPVRQLSAVRFRAAKTMKRRQQILAEVSSWLVNYNYLEEMLGEKSEFIFGQFADNLRLTPAAGDLPKIAAYEAREMLGFDQSEPIWDVIGKLESGGVKIFSVALAANYFFGLSVAKEDGGPAVVVNVWPRIPVERWIFSAVHEFGHLLLHLDAYDVSSSDEDQEQEREADRFASYFLMPEEAFKYEWNNSRGLYWVNRVLKVKRIFKVSYRTVLKRLVEMGLTDNNIWVKFNVDYGRYYKRSLRGNREPEPLSLNDFAENRLSRLVRQALEKELISSSRGAEILRLNMNEMREWTTSWLDS